MSKSFTRILVLFVLLLASMVSSCRKDEGLEASEGVDKSATTAQSASLGSVLAVSGTIKINLDDTTYIFDARKDSIAFVRVDTAGVQYFGITAINDAHTVSFGISGMGNAVSKKTVLVAGSQMLINSQNKYLEFTLNKAAHELELGKLTLKKYPDNHTLAKGTFTTFLSKDTSNNAVLYKTVGSFDLKLK